MIRSLLPIIQSQISGSSTTADSRCSQTGIVMEFFFKFKTAYTADYVDISQIKRTLHIGREDNRDTTAFDNRFDAFSAANFDHVDREWCADSPMLAKSVNIEKLWSTRRTEELHIALV